MAAERGRIRITGFDPERVQQREALSDWRAQDEYDAAVSRYVRAWRRFRRNRTAMIGLITVLVMCVIVTLAKPITIFGIPVQPFELVMYDPTRNFVGSTYEAPSLAHPMGTNDMGQDIFSRIVYGGRYSISIGFVVVGLTFNVGVTVGAVAAYYGGWVDEIVMRLLDVIFAFPGLVLALVIVSMLGGGYWQLVIALSIFGWAGYARLIRAEVLSAKENEYVLAARALGAKNRSIIFRHIVPNAVPPVIVAATLAAGGTVISVAALGFLGLGMPPTSAEWGTQLDQAKETLMAGPGGSIPWWSTVFPGLAIFIFVMAVNMVGDGITDAMDAQAGDIETTGTQQ